MVHSLQIHNVPGEWLSIIDAHVDCVPVNSIPTTKVSSSTFWSTSAFTTPLPKDLLVQRTHSPRPRFCPGLQLRHYLYLHVHLQQRTPDHRHRHVCRQGLAVARFCFALRLCVACFKPKVTWKRNGTAIVVRDKSSVVKRFIFVKKVQVLQGCLCISIAFVRPRWERETAHPWAKISARTWTWTYENDLITVKKNSMPSFMRNLVPCNKRKQS